MNFTLLRRVTSSFLFLFILLAVSQLQAAELRLIDGEFRYYENDELVEHWQGMRALPDTPETAQAIAQANAVPVEDPPEALASALATMFVDFEIEPEGGTEEQPGDPVCVVTTYEGNVSTTTDGAIADASASIGGFESVFTTTVVNAEDQVAIADSAASIPAIVLNPSSNDPIFMRPFDSITVGANDDAMTSGEFHFIALIGDELRIGAGSAAAAAALYPGSAEAQASSEMTAVLQQDVLDCQLTLVTLVETGEGSIQVDPEQASYQFGDIVEITAIPDEGWEFAGWSGDLEGMDNPLTVTISNNTEVFASFERQALSPLPVPVNAPLTLMIMALLLMGIGLGRHRKGLPH